MKCTSQHSQSCKQKKFNVWNLVVIKRNTFENLLGCIREQSLQIMGVEFNVVSESDSKQSELVLNPLKIKRSKNGQVASRIIELNLNIK